MPLPTNERTIALSSGGWSRSISNAFTAAARSWIVSSSVPSRSNATASTANTVASPESRNPVELRTHLRDGRRVVGRIEDRAAGDERVRARFRDRADVVDLHAAVHLQPDLAAGA